VDRVLRVVGACNSVGAGSGRCRTDIVARVRVRVEAARRSSWVPQPRTRRRRAVVSRVHARRLRGRGCVQLQRRERDGGGMTSRGQRRGLGGGVGIFAQGRSLLGEHDTSHRHGQPVARGRMGSADGTNERDSVTSSDGELRRTYSTYIRSLCAGAGGGSKVGRTTRWQRSACSRGGSRQLLHREPDRGWVGIAAQRHAR